MRRRTIPRLALTLLLLCGPAWAQDAPPPGLAAPPGPDDPAPPQPGDKLIKGLLELLFQFESKPIDDARIAGVPAGRAAGVLDLKQAYDLAIIQSRAAKPERFEALDAPQVATRAGEVGAGDFARFRQDFTANRDFPDPTSTFLDLRSRLARIENDARQLAFVDRRTLILREMLTTETSGVRPIDVDQFALSASDARRRHDREVADYRGRLDAFKRTLGLSPHAPVTINLAPLAAFRRVFDETDRWLLSPRRELEELDRLSAALPILGDVTIGGRSVLAEIEENPDRLEEVLELAARVAAGGPQAQDEDGSWEVYRRQMVRHLAVLRGDYDQARAASVLAIRQMSDLGEKILDPETGRNSPGLSIRMTIEIATHAQKAAESRSRLVSLWNDFHASRLALNRSLGVLPFDDWAAFYGQFEARPTVVPEPPPAAPAPGPAMLEPPTPPFRPQP